MNKAINKIVLNLLLLFLSFPAYADIFEWHFQDILFDDGSTITGHITEEVLQDPAAPRFFVRLPEWDITTTAGRLPAFTYFYRDHGTVDNSGEKFVGKGPRFISPSESSRNTRYLKVTWEAPGVDDFFVPTFPAPVCQTVETTGCVHIVEVDDLTSRGIRHAISGSLTAVGEVPEPSTTALLSVGLILVGLGSYRARRD